VFGSIQVRRRRRRFGDRRVEVRSGDVLMRRGSNRKRRSCEGGVEKEDRERCVVSQCKSRGA